MLELKDIRKSYTMGNTKQEVLKGINIKFRDNEFASILGSSGSGKTTLLNLIGGLDKYDSGDLLIDGVSTQKYTDRDWDSYRNHRVGFIFQSYNLIMHQSVYSNVEIALTLSGVSKSERKKRVVDAIERVGLKEHINKKPTQLSGGQMQRVAIARALVNNPEIILADEPTGALDSKTSVQIMDLLKDIAKDKLIIMVTHNPELANDYSTRIIELKDGQIVNDSNPYDKDLEEVKERKTSKTSMSFLTSLSLSFNNLLTKKGRTFLTAFAGSIGIIGIALIIALSNGVNNYASKMEQDSLTEYPITLEKTSYDLLGSISTAFGDIKKENNEDGKIYSKDDIVKETVNSSNKGLVTKNNLKEFKKFIENNDEINNYVDSINYSYNFDLQVFTPDYNRVNPSDIKKGENSETTSIFTELPTKKDKYEVLAGKLPENYNEVVLIVDNENNVPDSILYSLGIKDRNNLLNDFEKIQKDKNYKVESTSYDYNDMLNKTYKVILNTDYYKEENGKFINYSNDTDYMKKVIDNGEDIKIVGVIKDSDSSNSTVGYTHDLTMHILDKISQTNMYKKQISNQDVNVITGEEFDGMINTYDNLVKDLGIYEIDDPSSISLYPKDYNSKEKIVEIINKYNDDKKANNQEDLVVNYADMMKSLVEGIKKVVNMVSYVLIALVAISLVVSSIMISIITYISVLERTKEIGILRAIGASKKDIKRVFRSETIIEGLVAGSLGIGITLLLSMPINAIVVSVAKIENIVKLPFGSATFLILLSVLLNVIAGSIPSRIAAKKDPVEALRND